MKNILLTYLSPVKHDNPVIPYKTPLNKTVETKYTNLAGVKALFAEGVNIDRIFAICTSAVKESKGNEMSAYDYFCSETAKVFPDAEIVSVDDKDAQNVGAVFEQFSDVSDAQIILDITGGFRDAVYTLTLISSFLEFKGLSVKKVVYSRKNDAGENVVEDYTKNFKLLNLINGVSEFVHFGNSTIISEHFQNTDNEYIKELVKKMVNISDYLVLGKTDKFYEEVKGLKGAIDTFNVNCGDDIDEIILKEMLPIIETKMFTGAQPNILSAIRWCVENNFIQQALTLYTEKVCRFIFNKKIIEYTGDIDTIESRLVSDKYTALFYTEFMSIPSDIDMLKDACQEIYVNHGRLLSKKFKKNNAVFEGAKEFIELYKQIGRKKVSECQNMNIDKKLSTNAKAAWEIFKSTKTNETLSSIKTNAFFEALMGLKTKDTTSLSNKIAFLQEYDNLIKRKSNIFKINALSQDVKKLAFDYVYLKALRNEINHASDNDSITEDEKKFFMDNGYKYSITTKDLKDEIINAINNLIKAGGFLK